jgi:hypothetical protein
MGDKVFDMYVNAEAYKSAKKSGSPYNPKTKTATVDTTGSTPTIKLNDNKILKTMKKYFGTDDAYSIWVPAAEQEYGTAKKKPSTKANSYEAG